MTGETRIFEADLYTLCADILRAGGVDDAQATEVARNIVWNELIGRENFGCLRMPIYLERVAEGGLRTPCNPRLRDVSQNSALLDADNGFGQHAAAIAMGHAVELAGSTGVGIVGVKNSNFFGTGAYFVDMAARAGKIGLAMSNSFPKVVAHGGLVPVFGTNPFAFGAPRKTGESLLFDMATSALAGSTVREHIAKGTPLPPGLAIDGEGEPITDPSKVASGALLPAAGAKGYGLSLMVEILAGVLTGAGVSDGVASMYRDVSSPGCSGQFMIAIDIARFLPIEDYFQRLETLIGLIKTSHPDGTVLLPGEVRWKNYEKNRRDGIPLGDNTISVLEQVAAATKVTLPWTRSAEFA